MGNHETSNWGVGISAHEHESLFWTYEEVEKFLILSMHVAGGKCYHLYFFAGKSLFWERLQASQQLNIPFPLALLAVSWVQSNNDPVLRLSTNEGQFGCAGWCQAHWFQLWGRIKGKKPKTKHQQKASRGTEPVMSAWSTGETATVSTWTGAKHIINGLNEKKKKNKWWNNKLGTTCTPKAQFSTFPRVLPLLGAQVNPGSHSPRCSSQGAILNQAFLTSI